jgi:hypothetical protein
MEEDINPGAHPEDVMQAEAGVCTPLCLSKSGQVWSLGHNGEAA